MATLTQASNQWASRPGDERFTSLIELNDFAQANRRNSRQLVASSRKIHCAPVEGDNNGMLVIGPNGVPVVPSHWSFGQLAARAQAPVGYMRNLPSALAADCMNYGIKNRDVEEIGVLLSKDEGLELATLDAATGPNYGRIWNADITKALVERFGDGVSGDWTVPGEFGEKVEVTKANTTLYCGDRDMFVFLADEANKVEIKNRRNGKPGQLSRGFFVWNSQVGSQTFGIATFYFDYVCCNRMVWGAEGFKEIRLRHTSGAPDRFIEQVQPAISRLATTSMCNIVDAIENAKAKRIGDQDEVNEFLAKRFSKSEVKAINLAHFIDEQRPIETIWDATTGVTAYAKTIKWQDDRVELERKGGAILQLAQ